MPIEHPVLLGQTATALTLLTGRQFRIHVSEIDGSLSVYEPHQIIPFDSEDALMVWLLEQIEAYARVSLKWFKDHSDVNTTTNQARASYSDYPT
jgi:hypothetical protein